MSVTQYVFSAKSVFDLKAWFVELYNHLSRKNYANGSWTPTITGMTGTPDVSAWYQRWGIRCDFTIIIDGTHSMSGATITLPTSLPPNGDGAAYIQMQYNTSLGTGFVDSSLGYLTVMDYEVGDEKVLIQGTYKVEGI